MPDFVTEGFARVAQELGRDAVGEAVENEHDLGEGSGIIVQTSTRGVMWYSREGNQPAFIPFGWPALTTGRR